MFNNQIFKITDNIYLSNLQSAHNLDLIKRNNIKTVVCLLDRNISSIYDPSINFFSYSVPDIISSKKQMIELAKKIYYIISTVDNSSNILIHCYAGRSRSVTCIIYYLMKKYNYKYDEILNYIRSIKPDVGPNYGYEEELKKIKFK